MAVHGKSTELWLDGLDLSAYTNKADVSVDVDTAETSVFKQSWKNHITGQIGGAATVGGLYDPLELTVENLLPSTGSVLTIGPAGMAAIGDRARLVSALSTSWKESSPVGGVVAYDWAVIPNGQVGLGQVLHALGAETADGSATYIDGGAATTNGAIAHLHVTSVSASDSIVVTIDDSADHSSWATIGTFASKAAIGAERLTIAGTVRRYVRATWDVTGTGVSITFGVALARL